jgi:dynein heavy chain
MEVFFRMISLIIADFLRGIVEKSMLDFVSLFDGRVVTAAKAVEGGAPLTFIIRLLLEDDTQIRMEPSIKEVMTTAESLFDQLLMAVDRVPRIETQLFSNANNITANTKGGNFIANLKPEQCIKILFETTYPAKVLAARNEMKANIKRLLTMPQLYITEFDRHKPLIEKSSYEEVTEFLAQENNTPDKMMEEVRKWRIQGTAMTSSAYPYIAQFSLVELHCDSLIKDLSDRAMMQANRIIEKMSTENRIFAQK